VFTKVLLLIPKPFLLKLILCASATLKDCIVRLQVYFFGGKDILCVGE